MVARGFRVKLRPSMPLEALRGRRRLSSDVGGRRTACRTPAVLLRPCKSPPDTTGTVVNGKLVLEGVPLTEGARITVVARGADEGFDLTEAQEDALLASLAEIERGQYGSLEELMASLPPRSFERDPAGQELRPRCRRGPSSRRVGVRRSTGRFGRNRRRHRRSCSALVRSVGGRSQVRRPTHCANVRSLFLGRVGHFVDHTADLTVLASWHSKREHQPAL